MGELTFPKRMRVLRPSEFDRVMRSRVSAVDGLMRVYGATNELGHPRLGLTVSRRMGNAVERNRWKRALREAFRLGQHQLPACDLVCIPHRDAQPDVPRLGASLVKLSRQIEAKLNKGKPAR
jgi:ribonuclease P protein component